MKEKLEIAVALPENTSNRQLTIEALSGEEEEGAKTHSLTVEIVNTNNYDDIDIDIDDEETSDEDEEDSDDDMYINSGHNLTPNGIDKIFNSHRPILQITNIKTNINISPMCMPSGSVQLEIN